MNINYTFSNERLISTALSHSSYANEHKNEGVECNERLEFLGDAILGFVVGEYIYKKFSLWPEGKLTKLRASVVCETMLSKKGREMGINNALKLGKGEEHTGGRERNSIIADAVESVIGAVYLDGGMEPARKFVLDMLTKEIEEISSTVHVLDAKTTLQEIIQRTSQEPIEYRIIGESGPAHCKSFSVEVCHRNKVLGRGEGHSKKEAEQKAAMEAINLINGNA
ncbi:MAG: ribonuclease III [Clostridia bacterium]|nr:ribonuclease III [Clostridia bacterium]